MNIYPLENSSTYNSINNKENNLNIANSTNKIKTNKTKIKDNFCLNTFNNYYYTYFKNLSIELKNKGNNKMCNVYILVCDTIKRYPFPIYSLEQVNQLQGIGKFISAKFEKLIEENVFNYQNNNNNNNNINKLFSIDHHVLDVIIRNYNRNVNNIDFNKEEIKKKKFLYHIEPYSGVWTALISAYVLMLQLSTNEFTIKDIYETSQLLIDQFSEVITLNKPYEDDLVKLKSYEFLGKHCNIKTILDFTNNTSDNTNKNNSFLDQKLHFENCLIDFAKNELEKSGINISQSSNQNINISLDENYLNAINNKQFDNKDTNNCIVNKNINNNYITSSQDNLTNTKYKSKIKQSSKVSNNNSTYNSLLKDLGDNNLEKEFKEFLNYTSMTYSNNTLCDNIFMIIDERELSHQGIPNVHFENMLRSLGKSKCKKSLLSLGDILWIYKDPVTNIEYVLDYILERKTLDDLAASIRDGRYREQKYRLKKSGISNVYYLFEGLKLDCKHFGVSSEAVDNAMLNTITVHDINIIRTDTIKQSVEAIINLDYNIRREFYFNNKNVKMFKEIKELNVIKFDDFQKLNQKNKNINIRKIFSRQLRCVRYIKLIFINK